MSILWSQMITAQTAHDEGLARSRDGARTAIVHAIEAVTDRLTGDIPLAEKLSWTAKEAAARALVAGAATSAERALLDGEASITGETQAALAARVILNADAYRAAIAFLTGLRRRAEAGLASAATTGEVDAAYAAFLSALAISEI
jgi:hypothetical protein